MDEFYNKYRFPYATYRRYLSRARENLKIALGNLGKTSKQREDDKRLEEMAMDDYCDSISSYR